jgi:signal transduction histidine kinase
MINLLSNAIGYNQQDGEIFMAVDADQEMARIKIRDTGVGIAEESLPHLFERFFRQDAARGPSLESNKLPGSQGLGLAIAQGIIVAHGGEISVTSQLGKGSEFMVKLPAILVAPLDVQVEGA